MKALVLASAFGVVTAVAMTLILRGVPHRVHLVYLAGLFLAGLCALTAVFLATPPDLGVLPGDLVAPRHWHGLVFALFLYTAGFGGGLLQLYNLASRGLSLRILIDILENPSAADSAQDVAMGYCAGRGLGWMYEKRLSGLAGAGLIERCGSEVALTSKGLRIAGLLMAIRRVLGVQAPAARGREA